MENRLPVTLTRNQNGQADRGNHKNDSGPCGDFRQQVGGAAWAKGRLRTLSAESASQIGSGSLLQKNDANQDETNQYV